MKLTKKLIAGLLAVSMIATGSSAFAAMTKQTITSLEEGSNSVSQNVTGTAEYTDVISVEVEWKDLQFQYKRTWDVENTKFKDAEWSLVTKGTSEGSYKDAGNAITVTNNSSRAHTVGFKFTPTAFTNDYTKRDYSAVQGTFYSQATTETPQSSTTNAITEQSLGLSASDKTATAWLWLSGNPSNKANADATVDRVGNYGFNDNDTADTPATDEASRELFGKVTVTLKS